MSERRLKASPLRDLAQMLHSFAYSSQFATGADPSAAAPARLWHRLVGEEFVAAYLEQCAGFAALPTSLEGFDTLLSAFEVSQVLRQLRWEMVNRPGWTPIALQGALHYLCLETDG